MLDDGDLEPWQEWVRRATHQVEDQLKKLNMDSWVVQVRQKQWRLAQRIASQDPLRWSRLAASWDPVLFFDGPRSTAHRPSARPKKRWSDDINKFLRNSVAHDLDWLEVAADAKYWATLEIKFVSEDWRQV